MSNLKKFFYKKKVIVTGHTGFKGSWLTLWLKTYGANIFGISKDIPTKPSNFNASKVYNEIKNYKLDILDQKKLKKLFLKIKPDYVFHLAAQSLVKKSYEDPSITWNTNLIGTLNILESLRQLNKNCVAVLVTSDKCYLNKETHKGYKESDTLGGEDPYSASKASTEILIKSYVKSFFKEKNKKIYIASVRAGNVIGGGDWSKNRLIPDCISKWSKNKAVKIRSPLSTRPWQHVLEAVYGYILLATKLSKNLKLHGEPFNFGPSNNSNYNVISLVKTISKFWKNIKWSIVANKNKLFKESNLLRLNIQKVKKVIKWKPILKFEECIAMTINWYRYFYFKSKDMSDLSLYQIKEYQKLLIERQLK
jgi:CDP-glucose 4,6-dehydratase